MLFLAAVKWLKGKGVVTGDKDEAARLLNTFHPNAPIGRQ